MTPSAASLEHRLGTGLALQSFAVLAVVCLAVYGWAYLGYRSQRADFVERQKVQLEYLFSEAREEGNDRLLRHKLGDMLVGNRALGVTVFKEDGTVYFQHGSNGPGDTAQESEFSLPSPGGDPGQWKLHLSIDTAGDTQTLKSLAISLAAAAIFGALLISAGGHFLVRRGLRPMRRLIEQTQALTIETRDQRLDGSAQPSELAPLVQNFNELLARLQKSYDQLEAFNADVAHELATPLTTLISSTEVVLRKQRNENELRQVLECNLEEFQRLARIVQDMLFLARADHGAAARRKPQQDLAALMRRVAAFHEAEMAEHQLLIEIQGTANIAMDTSLVERAVSNLLSNAVRYARQESTIGMTVKVLGGVVHLEIRNEGGRIPPETLGRIFDRFYRSDTSRSDAHKHHGLGLSIVAAIARMHGGHTYALSDHERTVVGFTMSSLQLDPANVAPAFHTSIHQIHYREMKANHE